ncbi:hypothetical protein AXFE_04630 [Acidithrix ferrooxidans]|uniref:Uncharacterized protein n=1 Tax=Acidithrix ferrooxidans TaxID=1280514 RepID=A0A0D8HKV7_9ACTN|nr:hypothetical protein AXFE_04630 [Acidithrix ferrooxidans]
MDGELERRSVTIHLEEVRRRNRNQGQTRANETGSSDLTVESKHLNQIKPLALGYRDRGWHV